jgi:hypothetical protein
MGLSVAVRLGELGLLADQRELLAKPGFEISEQRPGSVLAVSPPLFGAAAADVLLDGVEGRSVRRARGRRPPAGPTRPRACRLARWPRVDRFSSACARGLA